MIKRLRRKFIIVAMCSVFAVLAVVICAVNVINYVNVIKNADSLIAVLKEGGGSFEGIHSKPISPETPYETRYYTVLLREDGTTLAVNVKEIAAVNAQEAAAAAEELYDKDKVTGFYGNYRYSRTETKEGTIMYIFVDCTRELTSAKQFLVNSVAVAAGSLVLVFVLLLVFSGKVMKPMAESYAKQKRFITDASHEIKTPLTIIGADTDVLEMKDGANEWTQNIKEQVERLTSLTQKLVFLARMDEEGRTLNSTTFCISDTVEETIQPFYAVALARGAVINADIRPNITYCGDESMIRQLLSLLMDNALKYTDGTEVNVSLTTVGSKVQIVVKNRASYLKDGNLDVLFERFYRNDDSRNSETGGHGIGLSVAKTIVSAHKGKITARKDGDVIYFTVIL